MMYLLYFLNSSLERPSLCRWIEVPEKRFSSPEAEVLGLAGVSVRAAEI